VKPPRYEVLGRNDGQPTAVVEQEPKIRPVRNGLSITAELSDFALLDEESYGGFYVVPPVQLRLETPRPLEGARDRNG
jgi:hypothetical protein